MPLNYSLTTTLKSRLVSDSDKTRWLGRAVICVVALVWFGLVGIGFSYLWNYENTPGIAAVAPRRWPADSHIQPARDRATLIMLAHPKCPCTRASIGELAAIMAHCQGRLNAYVLFMKPEGFTENWEKTDLWQSASQIPDVQVISDPSGEEARRFSAVTSGQTLLYDLKGELLFSGGITPSRGHSGDNAGKSAIVSIINREIPDTNVTNVFGCPLFDPNSECRVPRK